MILAGSLPFFMRKCIFIEFFNIYSRGKGMDIPKNRALMYNKTCTYKGK